MDEARLAARLRLLSDQIVELAHSQPLWTAAEVEEILRMVMRAMLLTTLEQTVAESAAREN